MRHLLYFTVMLVSLTACSSTHKFKMALATEKTRFLYYGLDNPVTICVEKHSCRNISLWSDQATITGAEGNYIIRPTVKKGRVKIYVYLKHRHDSTPIAMYEVRVKELPEIQVSFGGKYQGDTISANDLRQKESIIAGFENFVYEGLNFYVKSFKIMHIREDSLLKVFSFKSAFTDEDFHEYARQIQDKDRILVYDIDIWGPIGKFYPSPKMFYIKD